MTPTITPTDPHQPSDEFRGFLEWQITRDVRRGRFLRRARTAVLVLVSVGIGSTASIASAQIKQGTQRDSLLEAARADATFAAMRLNVAQGQLMLAKSRVAAGASAVTSDQPAYLEVRVAEAQVARVALNIEEIKATSLPPRDELNAPLVNGRDFVKARIQATMGVAQDRLRAVEVSRDDADRRFRMGAGTQLDLMQSEVDVARAMADLAVLAERATLRQEFVDKGTPVEQLMRRLDRAQVRQDVVVAQKLVAVAEQRVSIVSRQQAAGLTGDIELLAAQLDLKQRQLELQRAALRLRDIGATD